ncbi:MAG TPA: hypothetical protein DDZ89_16810 [Clostridiales bacterium]|nr:hypothetical protein [Clostridiales bacterium]
MGEPNQISRLDELRIKEGVAGLRDNVQKLSTSNPTQAARLLNDPELRFATLYLLENQLIQSEVYKHLNIRNKNALKLIRLLRKKDFSQVEDLLPGYRQAVQSCLKWMLESGYSDDGLDDEFDEILDDCAILAVQVFHDESVVTLLVELIFNRNRQKRYIYDLIWTFFEIHNPKNLLLIVERLRSSNPRDVKLAMKLLAFIPIMKDAGSVNRNRLYMECVSWIKENAEYLEYTGETFQQANSPIPYNVSYESKYLHKAKKDNEAFKKDSLEGDQANAVDAFLRLNEKAKEVLSDYSNVLYEKDQKAWKEWIKSPLDEQIKIASRRRGRYV